MTRKKNNIPLKQEINQVRASLIKQAIKKQYKNFQDFNRQHLPGVADGAFRLWFFPPIHISDKKLIKMEQILSISKDEILDALIAQGITYEHLVIRKIKMEE